MKKINLHIAKSISSIEEGIEGGTEVISGCV